MWLYIPGTSPSSPSAPASADSNSVSTSPAPEPELWVSLSGKPMQRPLSWRGWKSRPWIRLLSGTTLLPLTADRGLDEYLSSLPVFRASPSPSPASAKAPPMSDGSGTTSPGSFAKWDPATSSWKTSQACFSFAEALEESSVTWPKWGSTRSGDAFAHRRWVPRTGVSGSSSSPPGATTSASGPEYPTPSAQRYGSNQGGAAGRTGPVRPSLDTWAKDHWPTTTARDSIGARNRTSKRPPDSQHHDGVTLSDKIQEFPEMDPERVWQTPVVPKGGGKKRGGPRGKEKLLPGQAEDWPTPRASANENRTTKPAPSHGKGHGRVLAGEAAAWPTPRATDMNPPGIHGNGGQDLRTEVDRWPTPRTKTSGQDSGSKQRTEQGANPGLLDAAKNWPTPKATEAGSNTRSPSGGPPQDLSVEARNWPTPRAEEREQENSRDEYKALSKEVKDWPTPQARDFRSVTGRESEQRENAMQNLNVAANAWPTPRAGAHGTPGHDEKHPSVEGITKDWPTPAARDFRGANSEEHVEKAKGRAHMDQLPNFVAHAESSESPETDWSDFPLFRPDPPTGSSGEPSLPSGPNSPPPSDESSLPEQWKTPHGFQAGNGPDGNEFSKQVRKDAPIPPGEAKRLNPLFVGWLMGWPPLWHVAQTRCGPQAMAWWAFRQRQLLWSLLVGSA